MKRIGLITLSIAALTIGLLASCHKEDEESALPEEMTMVEILATNPDIPETDEIIPPVDAWINPSNPDCAAFVVNSDGVKRFFVKEPSIGFSFSSDIFTKMNENAYYLEDEDGAYIVHLTDGKFTSFEYQAASESIYVILDGIYAPAPKE